MGMAFISYYFLINKYDFSLKFLLGLAIVIRIILVFSFPNLSDDIYRFIWDGTLIHEQVSPYQYLPSQYLKDAGTKYLHELYPLLNSPNYYSVYPPIAQMIFYISSWPTLQSTLFSSIIIKILLLVAEVSSIFFGIKILKIIKLPSRNILWYALNPLVLIEIMGNVHFEGFMICFFILFLYFLKRDKIIFAAIFMALSIGVKLIPLLFLPYFLFKWKLKKSIMFYGIVGLASLVLFIPIFFQLSSFGDSLDLYFRTFEFNASVYYLFRYLGFLLYGYNNISLIGPVLAMTVFAAVFYKAYTSGQKFSDFLSFSTSSLMIFLLLSTTVHPWYLCLGVSLCALTGNKNFIIWSILIVLSYAKYMDSDIIYYILIALEYAILALYIIWEMNKRSFRIKVNRLDKSK